MSVYFGVAEEKQHVVLMKKNTTFQFDLDFFLFLVINRVI